MKVINLRNYTPTMQAMGLFIKCVSGKWVSLTQILLADLEGLEPSFLLLERRVLPLNDRSR